MASFQENMNEYQRQLEKGVIQKTYRGLMEYMLALRTRFQKRHPDYVVPGSLYTGYMDMTYFSVMSKFLQQRKLKIAVVFIHEACRFEVWLAGVNKQVQTQTWGLLKESGWKDYPLVASTKGADAIIESILVEHPDFNNLDKLSEQIEAGTLKFIQEVEGFLSLH